MKGRKVYIVFMSVLMIGSVCASAMNVNNQKNTQEPMIESAAEDVELPVWSVGDSWTYDVEAEGGFQPGLGD